MYFIATRPFDSRGTINLGHYLRQFDFGRYVYGDKRVDFEKYLESSESFKFIADIGGAVFATLFANGYIDKNAYGNVVHCCRDIIQDLGFLETTLADAMEKMHSIGSRREQVTNLIVIAGCQDEKMLERRVESAVQFVSELKFNCEVVFSGKNSDASGRSRVQIKDESVRMEIMFRDKLNEVQNGKIPHFHRLGKEGKSTNTQSNMAEVFEEHVGKNKVNLVIVSSTFHLIRLAQQAIAQVREKGGGNVQSIILIGAEKASQFFRIYDDVYFKLAMFDVFHYLLMHQANGEKEEKSRRVPSQLGRPASLRRSSRVAAKGQARNRSGPSAS